jgi:hypothetical protein
MKKSAVFENPFRPGAGHMPPYLAGREDEQREFQRLLKQKTVTENMILTGLRGVGKTVLLETFKPLAVTNGWLWVGTDLSESASISETALAVRLLTDLAVVGSMIRGPRGQSSIGFGAERVPSTFNYGTLISLFDAAPGLITDKLKSVLESVWGSLSRGEKSGIVFAYDEAQTLADHASKDEYPLSALLDVFQSIQRKGVPFLLVLTGLPTLFPKCVEARTFSERMFRVVFLDRLDRDDSRDAITKPIKQAKGCPVSFDSSSVEHIIELSGGYPFFIQFICREVFDVFIQQVEDGKTAGVPIEEIFRKLDSAFYAGRWARATDRQRDLLTVAARLEHAQSEFTVQELVEGSKRLLDKPFSSSHANQMLASLSQAGLVYKNRHGKYSFAVPLLDQFILRQTRG